MSPTQFTRDLFPLETGTEEIQKSSKLYSAAKAVCALFILGASAVALLARYRVIFEISDNAMYKFTPQTVPALRNDNLDSWDHLYAPSIKNPWTDPFLIALVVETMMVVAFTAVGYISLMLSLYGDKARQVKAEVSEFLAFLLFLFLQIATVCLLSIFADRGLKDCLPAHDNLFLCLHSEPWTHSTQIMFFVTEFVWGLVGIPAVGALGVGMLVDGVRALCKKENEHAKTALAMGGHLQQLYQNMQDRLQTPEELEVLESRV